MIHICLHHAADLIGIILQKANLFEEIHLEQRVLHLFLVNTYGYTQKILEAVQLVNYKGSKYDY